MTEITEDQAIAIAKKIAAEKGWPWLEPARARLQRSGLIFGRRTHWVVTTNEESRGMNIRIVIDAASGKVEEQGFNPR